jgi:hypothetical protein
MRLKMDDACIGVAILHIHVWMSCVLTDFGGSVQQSTRDSGDIYRHDMKPWFDNLAALLEVGSKLYDVSTSVD